MSGEGGAYGRISDIELSNIARYDISSAGSGSSQGSYTVPTSRFTYQTEVFRQQAHLKTTQ